MRKQTRNKRIVCLFLVLMLFVLTVGCEQKNANSDKVATMELMEVEEVAKYTFDAIGGSDVMPIIGFYGPNTDSQSYNGNSIPNYYTEEMIQLIADSGINMIGYNNTNYNGKAYLVNQMMDHAEKFDLGVLVFDGRLNNTLTKEKVDEYINQYSNHPTFCGVYVKDEPFHKEYLPTATEGVSVEDFANIYSNVNGLGYFGYGNLFPIGMGPDEAYKNYIADVIEQWDSTYISYDMYPFSNDKGLSSAEMYFKNMFYIREGAEKANIPFMAFAQAGGQWNNSGNNFDSTPHYPLQGQFYWAVGTALACGAKGIQYFPLIQPVYYAYALTEPYDNYRNGLIGAFGNKTRWYYYAQDMNAQIAAVDHVLMNAVNKGVIASNESVRNHIGSAAEYLMDGTSWRELAGIKGDALVGCFNYQGKTALYVVNYDMEYAQNITLDLVDRYNVTVIQDAKESYVSDDSLKLTLTSGNSALVVFE